MLYDLVQTLSIETAAVVGTALGGFLVYTVKIVWSHLRKVKADRLLKQREDEIPSLVKKDIGVYRDLTELMVESKADRAFVVLFHNGQYYTNSVNQMKMSCTHEIVREGISKEQGIMQNLLISRLTTTVNELITNPYVYINTKESDTYFSQLLRHQGVGRCCMSVMKDGNILEGFVGVSYIDNGESLAIVSGDMIGLVIEEYASRIGFVLRNRYE